MNPGPTRVIDVIRFLAFEVLNGFVMYLGSLCSLWSFTSLFARRSFRTLNRAAIVIGVTFALLGPAMWSAAIVPGNIGGGIEFGLMITIVTTGLVIAIRIVWKGEPPSEVRPSARILEQRPR